MTNEVFANLESLCATLNKAQRRLSFDKTLSKRHATQINIAFDYLLYKRATTDVTMSSLYDSIAKTIIERESASAFDVVYEILDTTSVAASAS